MHYTKQSRGPIACLIVLFAFFIIVGCGGGNIPNSLRDGKVIVDQLGFQKNKIFSHSSLNLITDIYANKLGDSKNKNLIFAGSDGACFVSESSGTPNCFNFEEDNLYRVKIIYSPRLSLVQFLANGLWGDPAVALLSSSGKILWSYNAKYKKTIGPGIVNFQNGMTERIVLYVSDRGILFFDPINGQITDQMDSALLWDLKTADFNNDGESEILTLDEENNLVLMNVSGNILGSTKLNFDYSKIVLYRSTKDWQIFLSSPTKLYILSSKLERLKEFSIPLEKSFQIVSGAVVDLQYGAEKTPVIISLFKGRGGWHRTILFVHTYNGNLLFYEILEGDFQSIYIRQNVDGNLISFLIGGRGEVWEYKITVNGHSR